MVTTTLRTPILRIEGRWPYIYIYIDTLKTIVCIYMISACLKMGDSPPNGEFRRESGECLSLSEISQYLSSGMQFHSFLCLRFHPCRGRLPKLLRLLLACTPKYRIRKCVSCGRTLSETMMPNASICFSAVETTNQLSLVNYWFICFSFLP